MNDDIRVQRPATAATEEPALDRPYPGIGPLQAVRRFIRKAFVFSGRASRAEYWWVTLIGLACVACAALLDYMVFHDDDSVFSSIVSFVGYLAIVPVLALSVRRLHDENLDGGWVLVPIVLQIAYFGVFSAAMATGDSHDATIGVLIGLLLMALFVVLSFGLYMFPSNPKGARFDKPGDETAEIGDNAAVTADVAADMAGMTADSQV
ncbi:DUF805 domain-containing protein [Bifidobacterium leontopitheci]|uniref:DUF805 domain-containing protein n=1 Tax=Bifidobacterium leontopitheci TaxID=2650774 RepID=A0A6I1GHY7_9BIFI|nr:DUF805 domain-containing protein [Bifidobacterium leontopitheci]KAB7791273.1 hypothetical protein F7D09_0226 [Bifidobacterium leontopitheci]